MRFLAVCFLVVGLTHTLGLIRLLIAVFATGANFAFSIIVAAYIVSDFLFILVCFIIASHLLQYKLKIKQLIYLFYIPSAVFIVLYYLGGFNPYVLENGKYHISFVTRVAITLIWLAGYPYAIMLPFKKLKV